MTEENNEDRVAIPIDWHVPDSLVSHYATNITVQRSEHEYIVSFFEVTPPLIIGPPDVVKAGLQEIGSVRAVCVARVIIAAGRMPSFILALQGVNPNQEEEQDGG